MLTRKELERAMEEGKALLKGDLSKLKPGPKGKGWKLPAAGDGQDVVACKNGRGRIRGVVFDAGSAEKRRKAIEELMEMLRKERKASREATDQIISVMKAAMKHPDGRGLEAAFIDAMAPEVAAAKVILAGGSYVDLADVKAGMKQKSAADEQLSQEVQNGEGGDPEPHAGLAKHVQSAAAAAGKRFLKNSPSAAAAAPAPEPAQIAETERLNGTHDLDPEKDRKHNAAVFSICFPEGVAKAPERQAPSAVLDLEKTARAAIGREPERMHEPAAAQG